MARSCAHCDFRGERELVCPRCRLPLRESSERDAGPLAPSGSVGPAAWEHPTHRAAALLERAFAIGVWLDYSLPSIVALDGHLDFIWPEPEPHDALAGSLAETVASLGAYVGEVLCKELGARWVMGGAAPAVQLAGGAQTVPFDRARERFLQGPTRPLFPYVKALFEAAPRARTGDAEHWAAHAARANAEESHSAGLALARTGVEIDPRCVAAYLELAAAALGLGLADEAAAALERASHLPDAGRLIHRLRQLRGRLEGRRELPLASATPASAPPGGPPAPPPEGRVSASYPAVPSATFASLPPGAAETSESPITVAEVLAARRHLDFSVLSLAAVDAALVELARAGPIAPRHIWVFGCYLGEVVRRGLGGEWERDPRAPTESGVSLANGGGFCPFVWVQKRAEGGESIPARYRRLEALAREG